MEALGGGGAVFHERGTPVLLHKRTQVPPSAPLALNLGAPLPSRAAHTAFSRTNTICIQGYLANKKQRPSRTLQ